ncbi:MAG: hypothetical protein EBX41_10770, partial [Chitinophagia bacterium]|nr:hypothetical protein [Chitinophagia bacterium]
YCFVINAVYSKLQTNNQFIPLSKKKKIAPQASAPQPAQASGAPETEAKPIAPPGTDLFTQYGKYSSFITVGILLLIGIIVFRDFLTGEKIYYFKDITSDSYNFSYPILYNIADYIHTYGTPSWSFKVGMGQNIFPFFLRDPFDAILFLLGKDSISHGLVWLELLKITLAGYVFYRYLQLINLEKSITIIGAILFAYCGFMIEGSGWYLFTFEALNFALMLLAAEQLIAKGKSLLFPLTTFLIGISMPFNLYVDSLFIILYTIMRTYQIEGKLSFNIIRLYGQMLLLGFVGLLAAGPFLLENIVQLLESPRVGGTNSLTHQLMARPITEFSDKVELATSALRFFSNDMMGSGNDFKGWHNILEAPMFYCGIPCLLLAPQYIASLPANKRLFFIIFFVGWLLPAFFPYLRHA